MSGGEVDWRRPIAAHAEETYWTDYTEELDQPRRSIRWFLSAEGLGRVQRGEACWNCLCGFPAPLGRESLERWHRSTFRYPFSWATARKLIRTERCPLCGADCSHEMLELQLDEKFAREDELLRRGQQLRIEDEREREDRAEHDLPREQIAPPSRASNTKRKNES